MDRRNWIVVVAAVALAGGRRSASAQASPPEGAAAPARYRPAEQIRPGRALVAVFISSSTCVGNRLPGFLDAMGRLNGRLATQAAAGGRPFSAVGVATDWSPDTGLAYLRRVGPFDEYALGGNWLNSAVVERVWRDGDGRPSEPQVVLLERDVDLSDPRRIKVGADRVVARYVGADQIVAWEARGAPVAATAAAPGAASGRPGAARP